MTQEDLVVEYKTARLSRQRDILQELVLANSGIMGALSYGTALPYGDKQDLYQELYFRYPSAIEGYNPSYDIPFQHYLYYCLKSQRRAYVSKLHYRWKCYGTTVDIHEQEVGVKCHEYEKPLREIAEKYLTIDELEVFDRYCQGIGQPMVSRQAFDHRVAKITKILRKALSKDIKINNGL